MAFDEVQFPSDITYGQSLGGAGWNTTIISADSGSEQRVARWSSARHKYDVGFSVRTDAQLSTLRNFYLARNGAARGFRYKDWNDYSSASNHVGSTSTDDQTIDTGDGSTTQFQLIKTYTDGGNSYIRNITKPVTDTVIVEVDGVEQTEGSDFTVDTATGIITFDAGSIPGAGEVIKAGYEFDVPVRFDKSIDEQLMVQRFEKGFGSLSVILIEIFDGLTVPGSYNFGGASSVSLTADITISMSGYGRYIEVTPDASGHKIYLPQDTSDLPKGGDLFLFKNKSGSYTFLIYDDTPALLDTVYIRGSTRIGLNADGDWVVTGEW